MTQTFFGLEYNVAYWIAPAFMLGCGIYALLVGRKAKRAGVYKLRHFEVSRSENPKAFSFFVYSDFVLGFAAIFGAMIVGFDLGMSL